MDPSVGWCAPTDVRRAFAHRIASRHGRDDEVRALSEDAIPTQRVDPPTCVASRCAAEPADDDGPGQLEREDWFVAPAGIDDIFNPDADELWARVLARKGAHFALVARMPIDPSVN